MNYLSVDDLSMDFGERILFSNISFGLNRGDKSALIANNGSGKSTLLKIIMGLEAPSSGQVVVRSGIKVAFLPQEPSFPDEYTIWECLKKNTSEISSIVQEYESAVHQYSIDPTDRNLSVLTASTQKMDEWSAWDYEQRLKEFVTQLKISDMDLRVGQLSGGQKKRLAIAICLLDEPDLLLFDEPTNHLDVDMVEWLEDYLSRSKLTLLMVTHDRYFLDNVCNHIIELFEDNLYHHKGNYAQFLENKSQRIIADQIEFSKDQQRLKKELDWIRRSPKARTTKSRSRINAFHDLKHKTSGRTKETDLKLEVKMQRIGGKILELKKIRKSYGDKKILDGFDYTFKKGERIGIVGENGSGKSTFLNMIMGLEPIDSGKINKGETISFGYYKQDGLVVKEDKRVIDVLKEVAEVIIMADGSKVSASQFLQFFMFTPQMQFTPVSKLSGGEKRRLHLLMVLIKNPNFLILDEPTNDLDLLTLDKLEEFLESYQGCLLLVSHDRYFLDNLADHLFIFKGNGQLKDFNGSYTEWRLEQKNEVKTALIDEKKEKSTYRKDDQPKTKFTFSEKREFEGLSEEIDQLEQEKSDLENKLSTGTLPYEELQQISARLSVLIPLLEQKSDRWLELSEFAD